MTRQTIIYGLLITALLGITASVDAKTNILENLSENVEDNNINMNSKGDSFAKVLKEMDEVLQKEAEPCTMFDPQKPFLQAEGRRVSEIKCFEQIWEVKLQEETKKRVDQCQAKYGNEFSGIVGGRTSKPGEYPHMGALGWVGEEEGKYVFQCGSFLISDRFTLTAAHCYYDKNQKHPKIVRFGVINILNEKINPDQPPVDIKILEFIKHPQYRPNYEGNDIAAIKLAKRVTFNEFIQPACIMNQDINQAIITGWGSTNEFVKEMSDELQVAKVDVLKNIECKRKWKAKRNKYWPKFLKSQMCAAAMNGVADICGGDSGGPLQSEINVNTKRSIHNVVGITSLSASCGSRTFPSVYTRVSSFIDWIEEVVWDVKSQPSTAEDKHSQDNEVDPSKNEVIVTKRETEPTADDIKVSSVQKFDKGYLFWFDTKKESQWVYVDNSLLIKNKNSVLEQTGNELK